MRDEDMHLTNLFFAFFSKAFLIIARRIQGIFSSSPKRCPAGKKDKSAASKFGYELL
jgi:hypothetical protein